MEHAYTHGRPTDHHPSYVHLTLRDQASLHALRTRLDQAGIATSVFREPYQDWGLTAIACLLTEGQRGLLRDLPLWRLPTQPEVSA